MSQNQTIPIIPINHKKSKYGSPKLNQISGTENTNIPVINHPIIIQTATPNITPFVAPSVAPTTAPIIPTTAPIIPTTAPTVAPVIPVTEPIITLTPSPITQPVTQPTLQPITKIPGSNSLDDLLRPGTTIAVLFPDFIPTANLVSGLLSFNILQGKALAVITDDPIAINSAYGTDISNLCMTGASPHLDTYFKNNCIIIVEDPNKLTSLKNRLNSDFTAVLILIVTKTTNMVDFQRYPIKYAKVDFIRNLWQPRYSLCLLNQNMSNRLGLFTQKLFSNLSSESITNEHCKFCHCFIRILANPKKDLILSGITIPVDISRPDNLLITNTIPDKIEESDTRNIKIRKYRYFNRIWILDLTLLPLLTSILENIKSEGILEVISVINTDNQKECNMYQSWLDNNIKYNEQFDTIRKSTIVLSP